MGTLDLVTKVNFSTIRSPLRIGDYLGKPVGALGVLGFDMEPPPAGVGAEPPAGSETLPGVPVGMLVPAGILVVLGLVEPFTPAPLGLILEPGMVEPGVVGLTVLESVAPPGISVAGVVVPGVVAASGVPVFFMEPVVDFLVFLALGLVLGLV